MGSAAGARAGEEAEEDAAEADGAWAPRPWGVQRQEVERSRGTRWEVAVPVWECGDPRRARGLAAGHTGARQAVVVF
jgi:hypothetical protein